MVEYIVDLTVKAMATIRINDEVAETMTPDERMNFAETVGVAELNLGDLQDADVHVHSCSLHVPPKKKSKKKPKT